MILETIVSTLDAAGRPNFAPMGIAVEGERVLLRIHGRYYELSQQELRNLLGLPAGPPGLACSSIASAYRG